MVLEKLTNFFYFAIIKKIDGIEIKINSGQN